MEYLGYQVDADEIERANRVGSKSDAKTGSRAIVVELVSYKLKQSILVEAANKLRHTPYRYKRKIEFRKKNSFFFEKKFFQRQF